MVVYDGFHPSKTIILVIENYDDDPLPERKLWAAVLASGIAGCVSGDHFEASWIRSRRVWIGSYEWICTEALEINCKEPIRELCLKNAGKYKNVTDFLKDCNENRFNLHRKRYTVQSKLKKTFRRTD